MEEEMYTPQPVVRTEDRSLLASQTDPSKVIEEISHRLNGEMWVANENKWIKTRKPLANTQGIGDIICIIASIVNQNTIFSNLNERQIRSIIIDMGLELCYLVVSKQREYQIVDSDLDTIVNLCTNLSFLSLMRCMDQGERKFLSKTISTHEQVVAKPERKGGMLSNIFSGE